MGGMIANNVTDFGKKYKRNEIEGKKEGDSTSTIV